MRIRRPWQDIAISVCLLLALASVIAATRVLVKKNREANQSKESPKTYVAHTVKDLPQVFSQVKGLQISGVSLENQGTPQAALVINVTNNRDEAVMAIDFVAGKENYSGLREDGLLEEGHPRMIIPPHTLRTFKWNLGEIITGEDVNLVAAIFDNGKEEGDARFVNGIKLSRQSYQQQRRNEKRKNGGEQ